MTGAATIELAAAPVSWGVDFADDPGNPSPEVVLDGIVASGLRAMELGPPGYLPATRDALAARGLQSVGTFVFQPLHDRDATLAATRRALDSLARHGGRLLIVIDRPEGHRADTAGRPSAARRLEAAARRDMVEAVRRVASLAAERGVRALLHPHAGSRIEFGDEIDDALAALPEDELGLCLDTGHALFACDDPVAQVRRYGHRIEHVHIKDVDPARRRAALAADAGFWAAMATGVFCPVGSGSLDLEGLSRALDDIGYSGYATIEQDRRAGTPGDPTADLSLSVATLRACGLG